MTPAACAGVLMRLRRSREGGVWFFLLLLTLVLGERRLAEAHFNQVSSEVAIENDDVLDGDEVRVRLVLLNDDKLPSLPDACGEVACETLPSIPQRRAFRAPGRPAPRGPPPLASVAA